MRETIGILAVALTCMSTSRVAAQIDLSGSVDIAYKHDLGKDPDERSSRVNSSIKGLSPFSLLRTRLFADAAVTDQIDVFTTILFDQGLGHFDMEGPTSSSTRFGGWSRSTCSPARWPPCSAPSPPAHSLPRTPSSGRL